MGGDSGRYLVYTLGTSLRGLEEFLGILRWYGVEVVFDVRRFPRSRLSHFGRDELRRALEGEGIEYVYLGEELGGYRKGGYERHMETEDFGRGIGIIEETAKRKRALILCSERFPWKCHRRFIGDELRRRGFSVLHIIDKGREWKGRGMHQGRGGSHPLL